MNEKEAYLILQESSGIKKGDIVKVLRSAKSYKMGWMNSWVSIMNYAIGKKFKVDTVRGDGVWLLGKGYPFFVLELIKSAPKEVTMKEVNDKFGYEVSIIGE